MNRNQLKYFVAAAESRSFTKAAEQDRALERLSAYRASLTDSYDLDMFSRIVAYLLGDRDGLTDAGRAAQGRFRAKFG